jgi:hypothetical protein
VPGDRLAARLAASPLLVVDPSFAGFLSIHPVTWGPG